MGKSARDMLFRVMATEEEEDKNLRILNYAPGRLSIKDCLILLGLLRHLSHLGGQ